MPSTTDTRQKRLARLKDAWGFAELIQNTHAQSGWKMYVVRNYTGPFLPKNLVVDSHGLPGNPVAIQVIEHHGWSEERAFKNALQSLKTKRRKKSASRSYRRSA